MKQEHQNDQLPETLELKEKLFKSVILRDNIGEALWYIITAILVTSVVQYNIAVRGCNKDLNSILQNQAIFKEEEKKVNDVKDKASSVVYSLS